MTLEWMETWLRVRMRLGTSWLSTAPLWVETYLSFYIQSLRKW